MVETGFADSPCTSGIHTNTITDYAGLDVHYDSIAIAVASPVFLTLVEFCRIVLCDIQRRRAILG